MRTLIAFLFVCGCAAPPAALTNNTDDYDAWVIDVPLDGSTSGDGNHSAIDASGVDAASSDAQATPDALVQVDAEPVAPDAGFDIWPISLTDVTSSVGSYIGPRPSGDGWGLGAGAGIGDVTNDGNLDVIIARCDSGSIGASNSRLLVNNGTGDFSFTDSTTFAALTAGTCQRAVALGDYDNDGDLDAFLASDGFDMLLENNGSGSFTNVTSAAGVAGISNDIDSGAAWVDVNHDGLLDLFLVVHVAVLPPASSSRNANRLYLNRGAGVFEFLAADTALAGDGSSQAAAWADLDEDGDLEVYIANDRFAINGSGANGQIDPDQWIDPISFDSQGRPTYVDRSAEFNLNGPRSAMGVSLSYLDPDERPAIYVSDWGKNHLEIWNPIAGSYSDDAAAWNVDYHRNPYGQYTVTWGVRFLDLDRNGYDELFIVNGTPNGGLDCLSVSQLDMISWRPPGANIFHNWTAVSGLPYYEGCSAPADSPVTGRGVIEGDLDGDGDNDVVVTPAFEKYRFYRNDSAPEEAHWLRVRPRGTVSSPDPIGAVLEVDRTDGSRIKKLLYAGGDTHGQSDRVIEAGLADLGLTSAWLHWPSGYSQRLDLSSGFAIDSELAITEPNWLRISSRVISPVAPSPTMTYEVFDSNGDAVGAAAAGKTVTATRSDGVSVSFSDQGDGTYVASLPHPGQDRVTVVTVSVNGVVLRPRLSVRYQ